MPHVAATDEIREWTEDLRQLLILVLDGNAGDLQAETPERRRLVGALMGHGEMVIDVIEALGGPIEVTRHWYGVVRKPHHTAVEPAGPDGGHDPA